MSSDAIDIRYEPDHGPPRKVSFCPCADGEWLRVTLEWSGCQGCQWRETGYEHIDEVAIETGFGVIETDA